LELGINQLQYENIRKKNGEKTCKILFLEYKKRKYSTRITKNLSLAGAVKNSATG